MPWLASQSMRTKLTVIIVLTCAITLLLSSTIIIAYDNYSYRTQKSGEISAQAGLLAARMIASLEFMDQKSAQEYLSPYANNPDVNAAAVYKADGSIFASYTRAGEAPLPPMPNL